MDNNQVIVSGWIERELTFSHKKYGEGFYETEVASERKSGIQDSIKVLISDRVIDIQKALVGTYIEIIGEYRSCNLLFEGKRKLELFVFAQEAYLYTGEEIPMKDKNIVTLEGTITKVPTYRRTPLGREICDLMIAVNRPQRKSSYIPCICWGRIARYANTLDVGDKISISGRIQSREFVKKISESETERRTAYEVSVSWIAKVL